MLTQGVSEIRRNFLNGRNSEKSNEYQFVKVHAVKKRGRTSYTCLSYQQRRISSHLFRHDAQAHSVVLCKLNGPTAQPIAPESRKPAAASSCFIIAPKDGDGRAAERRVGGGNGAGLTKPVEPVRFDRQTGRVRFRFGSVSNRSKFKIQI